MMRQEILDKLRESRPWNRIRDRLAEAKPAAPTPEVNIQARVRAFAQRGRAGKLFPPRTTERIREAALRAVQRLRACGGQARAHPALARVCSRPGATYACVAASASLLALGLLFTAPKGTASPQRTAPKSQAPRELATKAAPAASLWQTVVPRLDEVDRASMAALNARLSQLDAFFAECKKGVPSYADALLGGWGKLAVIGNGVQGTIHEIARLLGQPQSKPTNTLAEFAHREFRTHVLDSRKLNDAVRAIASGYQSDLAALESKLLVDLLADLDDKALGLDSASKIQWSTADVSSLANEVIVSTLDEATEDLAASALRFGAATVVGSLAERVFASDNDPFLKRTGINVGAGIAAERAINAGLEGAGYTPARDVIAKVNAGLDRVRARIADGDPKLNEAYATLCLFRDLYPDPAVIARTTYAAVVLGWNPNLGVRQRLLEMHKAHALRRKLSLHRHLGGPGTAPPEGTVLDLSRSARPDEILKYAEFFIESNGGTKP